MSSSESASNNPGHRDRIKVLFCINTLTGGGAEKLLIDILRRFDYGRYSVDLLLFHRSGVYLEDIPDEVSLLTLEDEDILARTRYDVEIAFLEGMAVRYVARREGTARKIAWIHTDLYDHHWTEAYYDDYLDEKADYSRMDEIVFVSTEAKRQFRRLFPGIRVPKTIVHNYVDAEGVRSLSRAFAVEKNKLTLCCVGRLTAVKGHPRLISVVDKLIHEDKLDFELWILGDGEQKSMLEELIKLHSLEGVVFLKGFHKNPFPFMKAADLFVLPSLAEGFSLVTAEAMSLGRPVLVTECSGQRELLDGGNCGMLVENTEAAIHLGLKKMITDEALRDDYARKALSRSAMFDADKTMGLIHELLTDSNNDAKMDLNERILNHMILSSAASRDVGLLDGKMGMILFLMNYARASGNGQYREIAEDMLDELWNEVTVETPAGLASGLCGVGWGIVYLIRNGFVDGDADEVCEEADGAVCLQKIHPGMDLTLDSGLEGMLHYIVARICDNRSVGRPVPFDRTFLDEVHEITKGRRGGIFALYNRCHRGLPCEYRMDPADFIPANIRVRKNLAENPLGLRGLTGYLYKQLIPAE